jgi:predicted component of type VI protein secretion system
VTDRPALLPDDDDDEGYLTSAPPGDRSFKLKVSIGGVAVGEHKFDKELVTIGRDPSNDLPLDNPLVSRTHAVICRSEGLLAIVDKESENQTYVNGKVAEEIVLLNDGDEILVGKFEIKLETAMKSVLPEVAGAAAVEKIEKLGGATLKMSAKTGNRLVRERGRAKGYVVLPASDARRRETRAFVAEHWQAGRDPDCDLKLGRRGARKSVLITRGYDAYHVVNATGRPKDVLLNGHPLVGSHRLADGDSMRVGREVILFSLESEEAEAAPATGKDAPAKEPGAGAKNALERAKEALASAKNENAVGGTAAVGDKLT